MRDEIDARIWNEHGHQFSEDLHRLFKTARDTLKVSLRRLHAIEFHAPWRKTPSC